MIRQRDHAARGRVFAGGDWVVCEGIYAAGGIQGEAGVCGFWGDDGEFGGLDQRAIGGEAAVWVYFAGV